jgi:V/A-type H+-transporting ATPase subunit D
MARRPAPTKVNLFRAQKDLRFASEGRDLLQQKRDVLVLELMHVVGRFSAAEQRLRGGVTAALGAFLPARAQMGAASFESLFAAARPEPDLVIEPRAVMGLVLPRVSVVSGGEVPHGGPMTTPSSMDGAVTELRGALESVSQYVEVVATLWRLAAEVEKTQRRINALDSIVIPAARDDIRWIRAAMEENDREELFRRKLLRRRAP